MQVGSHCKSDHVGRQITSDHVGLFQMDLFSTMQVRSRWTSDYVGHQIASDLSLIHISEPTRP
eukprot:10762497-Ditylum_brightwellii.AAC.1